MWYNVSIITHDTANLLVEADSPEQARTQAILTHYHGDPELGEAWEVQDPIPVPDLELKPDHRSHVIGNIFNGAAKV